MGLLPDTYICGLRMRRGCRERFLRHRGLAIPTFITARARCSCRDVCRDRWLEVCFEIGGGEIVSGIPGACTNPDFTYLVGGPCGVVLMHRCHDVTLWFTLHRCSLSFAIPITPTVWFLCYSCVSVPGYTPEYIACRLYAPAKQFRCCIW